MNNQLVFLRRLMYQMKMDYGRPCSIYRTTPAALNLETGAKTIVKTKYAIDRGIVIAFKSETVGFYSSALLKAAREFSYGGHQDQDIKLVTIDSADLPENFDLKQSDMFEYEFKRYEVKTIQKYEDNAGYQFVAVHMPGSEPNLVHELTVYQTLRVVQSARRVP
jgi:hypothetical protein